MWGLLDVPNRERYRSSILGAREAIPEILNLFSTYNIHATWATVGFLFFKTKEELLSSLPEIKPHYKNRWLSPYEYVEQIGKDEEEDGLHFGASLIEMIKSFPGQEIGTHTFSHYYCLEEGNDLDSFRADLLSSKKTAAHHHIVLEALVFPKNQFNPIYIPVLGEMGIKTYRGNAPSRIYAPASAKKYNTKLKKILRLMDAYINITGHNTYQLDRVHGNEPLNIPRSRFLRPYIRKLRWFEPLRFSRIKGEMTAAARAGDVYHLCFHPHNYGTDTEANLLFLERILQHFSTLREKYGMMSLNMGEVYNYKKHNS